MSTIETSIRIAVLDAFSGPLKNLGLELTNVGKKAQTVGNGFDLAAKISTASEAVGRFASAMKSAVAAPANEFVEFEHQMSKVAAVGGLAGEGFEKLKKQALDLGAATRYSATQAAEAQENLVSAGFEVNEIMKLTPVALSLATAADLELARSSEILSGAMKAFGKDASQAANVADVFASAAALSAADVEYLSEVVSKSGPVAKTLGLSIETVSAAAAAMAEAMIPAAEGGTALKTVMLRLSAPAKAAEKAFESLGFGKEKLKELQTQLGRGDMPGVLKAIGESFDKMGLTAVERVDKLKHIFGDEAVAQASVLIDAAMKPTTDTKGLYALQEGFRKVDGAANRMAQRMDSDTAGSLERLSSAWSGFLLQTGEKMAPALNQMSEQLQVTIGSIGTWVEKNPELAAQLGRVAILATAGAFALKGLLVTMSVVTTGFTLMKGAMSMAMVPISALSGAIGALIPAGMAVATFTASTVALGAAALAVGYGIGTLADHMFGLSDKLAGAFAWITGIKSASEVTGSDGLGKERQEYADGTVVDGKTGKVVKIGTGPADAAPKFVRDAKAAGATTPEEINAFSDKARLKADAAAPNRKSFSPLATPVSPLTSADTKAADATNEQTRVLAESLAELKRATEEQTRVLKRPRLGNGGSTGAGEGAH